MQERLVRIRNGKESVEILEAGSGTDLLYFPGAGGLNWDPFLEALSANHHVVAVRLPGTGKSTGDDDIFNIHDLMYYLLDFIDEMGIDGAVVMGHSLGGMVAAELAAVQPQRFKKVVLIAPTGLWNEKHPNEDFFTVRSMPQEMAARAFHDASKLPPPPPPPTDPDLIMAAQVNQARNMTVAAKYMWPIPDKGLKKRAHRIAAPTLILWGTSDRITPHQYAEDFKALLPNPTIKLFKQSGHMPQIEERDEVITVVSAFLEG
ncbi:MAG: alpha/beta fold hydrolase [Dehalococcoidia bacterium]